MAEKAGQLDHRAEALRLVDIAIEHGKESGKRPSPEHCLSVAQVHASLAIAEGQERVAEEIGGVRRELRHLNSKLHDAMTEPDCEEERSQLDRYLASQEYQGRAARLREPVTQLEAAREAVVEVGKACCELQRTALAALDRLIQSAQQNEGLDIRDLQGMRLRAHPAPSDSQGGQERSIFHCDLCHTTGIKPCDCNPASAQAVREKAEALKGDPDAS